MIDVSPPEGGRINDSGAGESTQEASGQVDQSEIVEFSLMLIKHTQDIIGLSKKRPYDKVNVEFDVMGKYASRSREIDGKDSRQGQGQESLEAMVERIVRKVLSEKK